jgi:hypothetical protein
MLLTEEIERVDAAYQRFVSVVMEGEDNRVPFADVMTPEQRLAMPGLAQCSITFCAPPKDYEYMDHVEDTLDHLLLHAPVSEGFRRYVRKNVMRVYEQGMPRRVVLWYAAKFLDPMDDLSRSPFDEDWALAFEVEYFNIASENGLDKHHLYRWQDELVLRYQGQVAVDDECSFDFPVIGKEKSKRILRG